MYEIVKTSRYHLAMDLLKTMFQMPEPRYRKCEFLFSLSSRMTRGAVVELGTYHGTGTIALCMGAEANKIYEPAVYTVDDYSKKVGWASEEYGPKDKYTFYRNIEAASVYPILVEKTTLDAAASWTAPVGLLFWDTGVISYNGKDNAMLADVLAWNKHILGGGYLFLRDTFSSIFNHQVVVNAISDEYKVLHEERGICILVKS